MSSTSFYFANNSALYFFIIHIPNAPKNIPNNAEATYKINPVIALRIKSMTEAMSHTQKSSMQPPFQKEDFQSIDNKKRTQVNQECISYYTD